MNATFWKMNLREQFACRVLNEIRTTRSSCIHVAGKSLDLSLWS